MTLPEGGRLGRWIIALFLFIVGILLGFEVIVVSGKLLALIVVLVAIGFFVS